MEKREWMHVILIRFESRLLNYACRMVPEATAREIVQEAFLRLWQEDMNELEKYVREWLYTVVRNLALDIIKKEGRVSYLSDQTSEEPTANEPDSSSSLEQKQTQSAIFEFLKVLPEKQREVIRLKFQEDLSYKEIASVTGLSVSHVGVLIHEAIGNLRKSMALLDQGAKI